MQIPYVFLVLFVYIHQIYISNQKRLQKRIQKNVWVEMVEIKEIHTIKVNAKW